MKVLVTLLPIYFLFLTCLGTISDLPVYHLSVQRGEEKKKSAEARSEE
jgi:hypothetical protein